MRMIELDGDDLSMSDGYRDNMRQTVPMFSILLNRVAEVTEEGNLLGVMESLMTLQQGAEVLIQITQMEMDHAIRGRLPDILAKVVGSDLGDIEQFLKDAAAHANGENTDSPEGGE